MDRVRLKYWHEKTKEWCYTGSMSYAIAKIMMASSYYSKICSAVVRDEEGFPEIRLNNER